MGELIVSVLIRFAIAVVVIIYRERIVSYFFIQELKNGRSLFGRESHYISVGIILALLISYSILDIIDFFSGN